IAAPRATIAELHAIACCAAHCSDAPRPPMRPHRCCFVESGATDPASTATAPSLERPPTVPLALLPALPSLGGCADGLTARSIQTPRAGPLRSQITQKLRC